MSKTSRPADAGAEARTERLQHWIAVLSSALLHLLFLFLALWSSPATVTSPQGSAAGSRMAVQFIGATPPSPAPLPTPRPPASRAAPKPPQPARVQSTLVEHAEDPVPADTPDETPDDTAQRPAPAPAAPPPTTRRRSRTWGQPPGLLPEDLAPANAGLASSPAINRGRGRDASAGASMEVGGYQVYYDLRSETRLRAWRDRGMTELSMPLPGSRRYMVCPLETALRRESGPCRLLDPDSPELAAIGDAREVIDMQRVYRQGELVWRGPGPYK